MRKVQLSIDIDKFLAFRFCKFSEINKCRSRDKEPLGPREWEGVLNWTPDCESEIAFWKMCKRSRVCTISWTNYSIRWLTDCANRISWPWTALAPTVPESPTHCKAFPPNSKRLLCPKQFHCNHVAGLEKVSWCLRILRKLGRVTGKGNIFVSR